MLGRVFHRTGWSESLVTRLFTTVIAVCDSKVTVSERLRPGTACIGPSLDQARANHCHTAKALPNRERRYPGCRRREQGAESRRGPSLPTLPSQEPGEGLSG